MYESVRDARREPDPKTDGLRTGEAKEVGQEDKSNRVSRLGNGTSARSCDHSNSDEQVIRLPADSDQIFPAGPRGSSDRE